MKCLLCPAIAVADCLCVPCGAKLWASRWFVLMSEAANIPEEWQTERVKALREIATPNVARNFMQRLDAARAEHDKKNAEFDRMDKVRG